MTDRPRARALAVLGSGSNVGKSLIATALGRLFSDAGVDVAPFKAQNMALQAGVAPGGGEMGRAQILQALACRQIPHVDMNPVLLKPRTETGAEVVVLGQARGTMEAREYFSGANPLADVADAALLRLSARHQMIVMEGAGSPVELNLMNRDFVNLRPARRLGAALVLVVDIDNGGVFSQVKGTIDLLPPLDRARLVGVIVNRFRGDAALFADGVHTLEALAGVPMLAVVRWLDHGLDEEDRPLDIPVDAHPVAGKLNVGVILHPHVANTEDMAPLLAEPDVAVTWIANPARVAGRDLLILPGTKATISDLLHHTSTGMIPAIRTAAADGVWVLGLCGGYQMLGQTLTDPHRTDGDVAFWPGLGLLPVHTNFEEQKILANSQLHSAWPEPGHPLDGYEIHHGRSTGVGQPLVAGPGAEMGMVGHRAAGAYLHGLLRGDGWRAAFLNVVRRDRGLEAQPVRTAEPLELRIDRWARHVRASLRPGAWERLMAI